MRGACSSKSEELTVASMGVRRRGKPAVVAEGRKYVYPDECKYWTDTEKVVFRATRIGHLLDIPDDQKMSGPIFSFLMTRRIHVFLSNKHFWKNRLEKLSKNAPGGHLLFGLSLWIRGTRITKGHPQDTPKAPAIGTSTLDRGNLSLLQIFGGKN